MSGNQPPPGSSGPYGQQPNQGSQGQPGPGQQGPQYQGPQYGPPGQQGNPGQPGQQGPQYGQPGQYGQSFPSYQQPGGQPTAGSPGTPASYSGPAYGAGAPGQPGQPPNGPQNPYGYSGGPTGPQQPKAGNAKIFIIVGAVVLALIVGAIVVGVNLRKSPTTTTDPAPQQSTGPGGGGGTSTAPSAKQSDAVKAYLEALATGNAANVLGTLANQPTDKTFMTDAVLAQSIKLAPITDITVADAASEYDSSIEASYKVGDTAVNTTVYVTESGGGYKVRDGYNELNLGSRKARTLPMLINGVAVNASSIRVFPGTYQFTTGAKYISYGSESTLTVESPTDYPRGLSDIEATLSNDGEEAFIAAVKKSVTTCLKSKKLRNDNCPNSVTGTITGGYKPKDGTIDWSISNSDPYSNMNVRLDYENPANATSSLYLSLKGESSDCGSKGACYFYPRGSRKPVADMTKGDVTIKWVG